MISRIFVLIIICYSSTLSQDYFPLKVGNSWRYQKYENEQITNDSLFFSINIDTTFSDGKKYYKMENSAFLGLYDYLRADSNFIYMRAGEEHEEINLFDLKSNVGEEPGDIDNFSNYLESIDTLEIFGTSTTVRNYRFYSLTDIYYSVSDKYGIVLYQVSEVFRTSYKILNCVINDSIYTGVTDITEYENNISNDIRLYQNYPNPFNPTTKIRYTLLFPGNVKIELYDAVGRKVETLFNSYRNSGIHQLEFTGENYSSGVYYYRLITDTKILTNKMILLK